MSLMVIPAPSREPTAPSNSDRY